MQNSKKHNGKRVFQKFPEVKKQLWGGEFWSGGGYIGTVGDGAMADTIRNNTRLC
jgi:putative transposase